MRRLSLGLVCAVCCCSFGIEFARGENPLVVHRNDWPWWRGPRHNGEADPDQKPPTTWSETENIVWQSPIPGRGHGSPIVVGDAVFLPTSDESSGSQSVLCFDRATGKERWRREVHPDGGMRKNAKSTAASSTIACDGERLYINFPNRDAVYTTALSLDGHPVWQTKISDYVIHQGYGSSPFLYRHLVLVSADNKGGGAIAGLDRKTGEIVWRKERPATPNYPSPIVLHVAGRDQLLMTGCDLVSSFDPLTGDKLWEIPGATTECVTSTVTDGTHIFTSGGYPKNHMSGVVADGSGKIAWENGDRVYVPSFVIRDGYLYGVMDAGVAACWKSDTGKEVWKARLKGNFTSSPVLVGDVIYASNESGETFLFAATPEEYRPLGANRLGDAMFATPTICGGRIYLRVVKHEGDQPREYLYCVGK